MNPSASDAPLLPVILGGDFGVYGIGRSFNEAFGCRCLCVANAPTEAITGSEFFDVRTIRAGIDDAGLLAELRAIAASHPDRSLVLMANHDLHSSFIARNAEALGHDYALPFPSLDVIERLTDKAAFDRACRERGIDTPGTVVVDFSGASDDSWRAPEIPFDFPVVAKAARGDAYDRLEFEGKRKIWFIEDADDLERLWDALRGAGFRDAFLVQELIPGDNTAMRSITAYVDSRGQVALIGSARVLLEDHAPTMIGNPVAMITEPFPELWEQATRLLVESGYRGFANFDVKIDPRDGRAVFFEVNPRIGRNNWYMTAAGANPMTVMVSDLVLGERVAPVQARDEALYSMVPDRLLMRYLRDDSLRERVRRLIRSGRRVDPLLNPVERNPRRAVIVLLQKLNHYRKFRRFYPEATDRSF
ncbi:carboxylate--amine ligase [Actinomyces sp. B33]|uniref:carboxylate--amine ligase n=1 Tax=Actinomyces sp. B33 TaxID=2942131 RepID=UPI00234132A2|nr:carboxylate--amine ligase [Actinomyces sp. B33]MDC4233203.1 carboxylate--amine ligase [Actinomyces sp. B33]